MHFLSLCFTVECDPFHHFATGLAQNTFLKDTILTDMVSWPASTFLQPLYHTSTFRLYAAVAEKCVVAHDLLHLNTFLMQEAQD